MNTQRLANILIGIAVLAGAYFLYAYFTGGDDGAVTEGTSSESVLPSNLATDSPDSGLFEEDFQVASGSRHDSRLSILNITVQTEELQSIRLDRSSLDSNEFKSLVDFTILVPPEPTGIKNPFSPSGQ